MAVRYPWAEWFKKKEFVIHKGVDYRTMSYVMAQQIRNKAVEHGVSVSIRIGVDKLQVKVTKRVKPKTMEVA